MDRFLVENTVSGEKTVVTATPPFDLSLHVPSGRYRVGRLSDWAPAELEVVGAVVPSIIDNWDMVTGTDSGLLVISATAPSSNGSAIIRYEYSLDDGQTYSTLTGGSPWTVQMPAEGTSYTAVLRAVNAIGAGPWTAEAKTARSGVHEANLTLSVVNDGSVFSIQVPPGSFPLTIASGPFAGTYDLNAADILGKTPKILAAPKFSGTAEAGNAITVQPSPVIYDPAYGAPVSGIEILRAGAVISFDTVYTLSSDDIDTGVAIRQDATSSLGASYALTTVVSSMAYTPISLPFAGAQSLILDGASSGKLSASNLNNAVISCTLRPTGAGGYAFVIGDRVSATNVNHLFLRMGTDGVWLYHTSTLGNSYSGLIYAADLTGRHVSVVLSLSATLGTTYSVFVDYDLVKIGIIDNTKAKAPFPLSVATRFISGMTLAGSSSGRLNGDLYDLRIWDAGSTVHDARDAAVCGHFVDNDRVQNPTVGNNWLGTPLIQMPLTVDDARDKYNAGSLGQFTAIGGSGW